MEYPKPVMRLSELRDEMGFPMTYLMNIYRDPTLSCAWKMDPTKQKSPILFDTAKLEQHREKQMEIEKKSRRRTYGVV